jgi:DNA-binding SARP family transcriptional activator
MRVQRDGPATAVVAAIPGPPVRGSEDQALRLCLLNGFELTSGSRRIEVPTSAQRVVAFLALQERSRLRAFVAGALWPDTTEANALASLRSALWRLHRLGVSVVHASTDHIELDRRVTVDLRVTTAAAHAILSSARDPEAGDVDLLAREGVLLPDWYDDWVVAARERVQQLGLHALERLSHRLTTAKRFAEAIDVALAAVAAEPLRESANRALIGAYLAEGNAVSAIRQFETYRRLVAEELVVGHRRARVQDRDDRLCHRIPFMRETCMLGVRPSRRRHRGVTARTRACRADDPEPATRSSPRRRRGGPR